MTFTLLKSSKHLWLIFTGLISGSVCALQESYAYAYHQTTEAEKSAWHVDREIGCAGMDAFDIGIKSIDDVTWSTQSLIPHSMLLQNQYFKRDQISQFLKNEKHKDTLVLHVAKFVSGKAFDVEASKPFLESLGYRRLVVERDVAFFPIPVLLDETLDDADIEKKEQLRLAEGIRGVVDSAHVPIVPDPQKPNDVHINTFPPPQRIEDECEASLNSEEKIWLNKALAYVNEQLIHENLDFPKYDLLVSLDKDGSVKHVRIYNSFDSKKSSINHCAAFAKKLRFAPISTHRALNVILNFRDKTVTDLKFTTAEP